MHLVVSRCACGSRAPCSCRSGEDRCRTLAGGFPMQLQTTTGETPTIPPTHHPPTPRRTCDGASLGAEEGLQLAQLVHIHLGDRLILFWVGMRRELHFTSSLRRRSSGSKTCHPSCHHTCYIRFPTSKETLPDSALPRLAPPSPPCQTAPLKLYVRRRPCLPHPQARSPSRPCPRRWPPELAPRWRWRGRPALPSRCPAAPHTFLHVGRWGGGSGGGERDGQGWLYGVGVG